MNNEVIKFRFDVSTFRLLGRELITDRVTALFELVKNSYDANSNIVTVSFLDVNPLTKDSKIIIEDDGVGMSFDDINEKWMVIGTNSKRKNKLSPPPYNRRVVGQKGVGRFAVDKLGSCLKLITKKAKSSTALVLITDWSKYEVLSTQQDKVEVNKVYDDEQSDNKKSTVMYFTDIENEYFYEDSVDLGDHGTRLEISNLRDVWTEDDISRAYRELSKLISPIKPPSYPFEICIKSNAYDKFKNVFVKNDSIKHATEVIKLGFNSADGLQETAEFNSETGKLEISKIPLESMGPVMAEIYYFDKPAKAAYKKGLEDKEIDGIKIYRDGIITTPFAEYNAKIDDRRDVLGIDKRRWSGFFDKVSSRDLIGFVEISDEFNPNIVESTNRQDFLEHSEYQALREFIIKQIIELEKYLDHHKRAEREDTKSGLREAKTELRNFSEIVKEIKSKAPPALKREFARLENVSKQVNIDINRGIKAYNELEKEKAKQETLFMSLMSLQDYASELSHVVRTSLSKIISYAKFIKEKYPDEQYETYYKIYAVEIYNEMQNLNKAIDFMLSYAKSNIQFEVININDLLSSLFNEYFRAIFEKENIKTELVSNEKVLITHNRKFFEDIVINLITNSVKALKDCSDKRIKCTVEVDESEFVIVFSDSGIGIPAANKNKIFDIYFTTTAQSGGAGVGLYTVKKRIQALQGRIELVENEFKPTGATFKITIPFANFK